LHPTAELVVVDDGSTDATAQVAADAGARVVRHPYSMGNGAAIKSGARAAKGEILVFMDADGQHSPEDIAPLLARLDDGFDMVVGARQSGSQANLGRGLANGFYNWFSSLMVGQRIEDLTSGFRAVRADKFREFLYLFPNGFSYPTTVTMSFFRAGYPVAYVPIHAGKRIGKSHLRPIRDGIRFLLIIFKVGTLYSPLKIFLPIATLQGLFRPGLLRAHLLHRRAAYAGNHTDAVLRPDHLPDRAGVGADHAADVRGRFSGTETHKRRWFQDPTPSQALLCLHHSSRSITDAQTRPATAYPLWPRPRRSPR
jgi:glycosyltransferase involved in cell wall biosynthesis